MRGIYDDVLFSVLYDVWDYCELLNLHDSMHELTGTMTDNPRPTMQRDSFDNTARLLYTIHWFLTLNQNAGESRNGLTSLDDINVTIHSSFTF